MEPLETLQIANGGADPLGAVDLPVTDNGDGAAGELGDSFTSLADSDGLIAAADAVQTSNHAPPYSAVDPTPDMPSSANPVTITLLVADLSISFKIHCSVQSEADGRTSDTALSAVEPLALEAAVATAALAHEPSASHVDLANTGGYEGAHIALSNAPVDGAEYKAVATASSKFAAADVHDDDGFGDFSDAQFGLVHTASTALQGHHSVMATSGTAAVIAAPALPDFGNTADDDDGFGDFNDAPVQVSQPDANGGAFDDDDFGDFSSSAQESASLHSTATASVQEPAPPEPDGGPDLLSLSGSAFSDAVRGTISAAWPVAESMSMDADEDAQLHVKSLTGLWAESWERIRSRSKLDAFSGLPFGQASKEGLSSEFPTLTWSSSASEVRTLRLLRLYDLAQAVKQLEAEGLLQAKKPKRSRAGTPTNRLALPDRQGSIPLGDLLSDNSSGVPSEQLAAIASAPANSFAGLTAVRFGPGNLAGRPFAPSQHAQAPLGSGVDGVSSAMLHDSSLPLPPPNDRAAVQAGAAAGDSFLDDELSAFFSVPAVPSAQSGTKLSMNDPFQGAFDFTVSSSGDNAMQVGQLDQLGNINVNNVPVPAAELYGLSFQITTSRGGGAWEGAAGSTAAASGQDPAESVASPLFRTAVKRPSVEAEMDVLCIEGGVGAAVPLEQVANTARSPISQVIGGGCNPASGDGTSLGHVAGGVATEEMQPDVVDEDEMFNFHYVAPPGPELSASADGANAATDVTEPFAPHPPRVEFPHSELFQMVDDAILGPRDVVTADTAPAPLYSGYGSMCVQQEVDGGRDLVPSAPPPSIVTLSDDPYMGVVIAAEEVLRTNEVQRRSEPAAPSDDGSDEFGDFASAPAPVLHSAVEVVDSTYGVTAGWAQQAITPLQPLWMGPGTGHWMSATTAPSQLDPSIFSMLQPQPSPSSPLSPPQLLSTTASQPQSFASHQSFPASPGRQPYMHTSLPSSHAPSFPASPLSPSQGTAPSHTQWQQHMASTFAQSQSLVSLPSSQLQAHPSSSMSGPQPHTSYLPQAYPSSPAAHPQAPQWEPPLQQLHGLARTPPTSTFVEPPTHSWALPQSQSPPCPLHNPLSMQGPFDRNQCGLEIVYCSTSGSFPEQQVLSTEWQGMQYQSAQSAVSGWQSDLSGSSNAAVCNQGTHSMGTLGHAPATAKQAMGMYTSVFQPNQVAHQPPQSSVRVVDDASQQRAQSDADLFSSDAESFGSFQSADAESSSQQLPAAISQQVLPSRATNSLPVSNTWML